MVVTPPADGPRSSFRLLGDQPGSMQFDALGFDAIAEELTRIVLSSRAATPFTIGIEADWGMGKSSLMRRVREKLDVAGGDGVTTVWFNAWTADEGEVLEGLIKTVLDRMDPNSLRRALRDDRIKAALRIGTRVAGSIFHVGDVVDEIWKRIAVDPRARNEMRALMEKAMADWVNRDRGVVDGRLLVVFIDDLDRCSPSNVFQVFEAMKLYLDAPGFVFVVGYDATAVSDAILHEKGYSKNVKSGDYIEKIVQTVYRIQPPGDDEAQALMRACFRDSGTEGIFDPSAATLVIDHNSRNPRRIKRFINAFVLEYARDPEWELDPQLGARSLIAVLILLTYFPEFAELLANRRARDPIAEFLDYLAVRAASRNPPSVAEAEWSRINAAFNDHGLPPPDHEAGWPPSVMDDFEGELPEFFPSLVKNAEFATLLTGFGDEAARRKLRDKLQRRPLAATSPSDDYRDADPSALQARYPSFAGLKIVWLNDDPSGDEPYVETLRDAGAMITQTASSGQARELLADADVFISDIGRPGNDSAGLDDLAAFREAYHGPAIFFTARVTPSRRVRAAALGARITSNGAEFMKLLQEEAQRLPEAGGRQSAVPA